MGKPALKMLLGAAAGIVVWLIFEPMMPSNPFSSEATAASGRMVGALGIAIGLVLGGFNGYQQGGRIHILRGLILGGLLGAIGASLGSRAGDGLGSLVGAGNVLLNPSVSIFLKIPVRILALAPIGLFIGAAIGASTLNWKRALQGAIGGLIGGGIGAAVFDPASDVFGGFKLNLQSTHGGVVETGSVARVLFCLLLGAGIGLFVGIVENVAKVAWLRMSLGRNEGREWVVDSPITLIGRSETANVPLFGDSAIALKHASIHRRNSEYLLVDEGSPTGTYLNGQRVTQAPLFHGAVIQIGGSRLEFLMKVGSAPHSAAEVLRSQGSYAFAPTPYAAPAGVPYQPGVPAAATVMGPSMPTQMVAPANIPYPQYPSTQAVPAQPAPGLSSNTLVAISGPLSGQRYPVTGNLEIGREGAGIALSFDSSASRKHASLTPSAGGLILSDLGSTNGTFVNDQKIQAASLTNGDLLRIGITTFRVE